MLFVACRRGSRTRPSGLQGFPNVPLTRVGGAHGFAGGVVLLALAQHKVKKTSEAWACWSRDTCGVLLIVSVWFLVVCGLHKANATRVFFMYGLQRVGRDRESHETSGGDGSVLLERVARAAMAIERWRSSHIYELHG